MDRHPYSGLRPGCNAFGTPIRDPGQLQYHARVNAMRRAAGALQALGDRDLAWLGQGIAEWLAGVPDGDLVRLLGLRPPAGSNLSPPALMARHRRDDLLIQLSVAAGGDRAALRLFEPGADPGRCAELVAQLQHDPPGSAAAFTRARQRISDQHW